MSEQLPTEVYERAERLLPHHRAKLALRVEVTPHWIDDGSRFWYLVDTERGPRFVIADPEAGTREDAFDHEALAAALAGESGERVAADDLPFREIEVTDDGIRFEAFESRWTIRPDGTCARDERAPESPFERESPDGTWAAFIRGDDLWVRSIESGAEFAVTDDGTPEFGYANHPDHSVPWTFLDRYWDGRRPPVVRWSPDSRRILFHRTDQRGVGDMHLVNAAPLDDSRPRGRTYRYPMPGDERVTHGEWLVFDVAERKVVPVTSDPFMLGYISPLNGKKAWWSSDSNTIYTLEQQRDRRVLPLLSIDAATGETRELIRETGETRVEPNQWMGRPPILHVLSDSGQALWFSQRDGWGHLYLYDLATGDVVRQVTRGEFLVLEIAHVDEDGRVAHLVVGGLDEDPYLRSLVSVHIDGDTDGGELTRLTEPGLDHQVSMPPHGRWFVDSASTVAIPTVTTVRDLEGKVLLELERGDVSRLIEVGWTPPERFRTIADDGVTPIYGVLHKPHGFDPDASYPVVDHTYPGPQIARVGASFHDALGFTPAAEPIAALGFVVVALDGRGTPGRSKAFHDHSYRNLGGCGAQEDHVAAIRQLAGTRPWMDLERVGMFGHSGGGFATGRAMLRFPEFFRVGVSESGNHDNRIYSAQWAETYDSHGRYDGTNDESLSNTLLAENLAGKILFIHGDVDDNVTPHQTLRLVDRLIAANKDFDLLIVPGADHGFSGYEHYVTRKRWDFLVRHLLHVEPPEYRIGDFPHPAHELLSRLRLVY